ncbi:MAG: tetratricopeptide repeat protein [Calditrichaeota bacterium]|nr:MAG: tetratricopeptide repeat protein [Calditrichota bacterium]
MHIFGRSFSGWEMKRALYRVVLWMLPLALASLMYGCAGSRNGGDENYAGDEDYSEIEELLGISSPQQGNSGQGAQQEGGDDLLQLLGDEQQPQAEAQPPQTEPETEKRLIELQDQVDKLKKELREKNKTIADLKAQLMVLESERSSGSGGAPVLVGNAGSMSDEEYQRNYRTGLDLFQSHRYREAIEVFESLLAANSEHSLADNAQYWIGECYYMLGDYQAAILAFEKVFTYKNSNKNDYAQFKLGLCYYHLNDRKRAREEFQSFVDNYRNSPLVPKAEEYLAKL